LFHFLARLFQCVVQVHSLCFISLAIRDHVFGV
jgi:hypothetical protein